MLPWLQWHIFFEAIYIFIIIIIIILPQTDGSLDWVILKFVESFFFVCLFLHTADVQQQS